DVLVVPAVAKLVDADEAQTVERIVGAQPSHHPLDDAADRGPADAHHVAERRLVGPLREVGDVLLELVGEPGLRRCPRHQLHRHPPPWTADATDLVAEPQAHPRHVQVPPATPLVAVVNRTNALEAPRAERHAGGRRDVEQHPLGLQVDRDDAGLLQREDPREYRSDAHGGTGLLCWLGSCKVAPPPCALSSPPWLPSAARDPSAIRLRYATASAPALPSNLGESPKKRLFVGSGG